MNEKEDLTPKTRREVLMCRDAAVCAIKHNEALGRECAYPELCAAEMFPLPQKSVPRIAVIGSLEYRFVDGGFQFRYPTLRESSWLPSDRYTPARMKALNDLIANPTVEVDDDGTN